MADQKPTRPQLSQKQLKAPSGEEQRRRQRRDWLLLALLLLLVVPCCLWLASQLALFQLGSNQASENVLSRLAADYATWQPSRFNPLKPELIGTIRSDQLTLAANPPLLGTIIPILPQPGGQTQIAAFATSTPTQQATPTATMFLSATPTATQQIIFFPFTNTPIAPTAPVTDTPAALPTNTSVPPPPPTPRADLAITKDDGVATVVPGGSVTYIITVTNNGPANVSNAVVQDAFPAEIVGATWTCAPLVGLSNCDLAAGAGNINTTVDLPNGSSVQFTVTAPTSVAAAGSLINTATVAPPPTRVDPVPGNNTATDTDTFTLTNDLEMIVSRDPVAAVDGTSFTYTITVINHGPDSAAGVTFSGTIAGPGNVTGLPGSCTPITTQSFTCSVGTITASSSVSVTVTVLPTGLGTIIRTALITGGEAGPSVFPNLDIKDTVISPLVITLTWTSADTQADLDLWVADPSVPDPIINSYNVALPFGGSPKSSSGGTMIPASTAGDTNCGNIGGLSGSESAGWPSPSTPLAGTYYVYISYYHTCGVIGNTVSWTVTAIKTGGVILGSQSGSGSYGGPLAPPATAGCPGPILLPGLNLFAPPTCGPPAPPYSPLLDGAIDATNYSLTFTYP